MAQDPTKGILTLKDAIRFEFGAIVADTAEIITQVYGTALTRDFLLKKIRTQIAFEDFPADQYIIVGFCRGDMSITQIATVLAAETPDPETFGALDSFAEANGIFWETLKMLSGISNVATPPNSNPHIWNATISMGGGKGIPLEAGHGIQMFMFNPDDGTIGNAGSKILGLYQLVGVFMEGSN